jgi:apolipoprotein N-acyltransferase
MIAFFCALLSGALFYYSQGQANAWALAWFAPVPLLWLAYSKTPAWKVLLAAFAGFCSGQLYLAQCYGGKLPLWVLAPTPLASSVLFAAAVLFTRTAWHRLPPLGALAAFPAAWTASEFAIGHFSPHGSFGSLAYSQVSFPAAIQVASLFGLYAVTFLLCLFANSVALLARGARFAAAVGASACATAFAFGLARLFLAQGPTVPVAALANPDSWRSENRDGTPTSAAAAAAGYASASKELASRGVRIVVIPEGAISLQPQHEKAILAPLAAVSSTEGILIIIGTFEPAPPRNRAFAFSPDGLVHIYSKRHLLRPFETGAPGEEPGIIGSGYGMAICKDLDFPRSVRADTRAGVRLLLVPANDFGTDGWIHARMAVMRGIENGCAVLRSAFNGLETASDAEGRLLASASTDHAGMTTTVAELPLGRGLTLYNRIGDTFPWSSVAATLFLLLIMKGNRRIIPGPSDSIA